MGKTQTSPSDHQGEEIWGAPLYALSLSSAPPLPPPAPSTLPKEGAATLVSTLCYRDQENTIESWF